MKPILLLILLTFICSLPVDAQYYGRSAAHRAVKRKVEDKMDSTYRKKGQKAVKDITYENDKRYKNPNNKVLATIVFSDTSFKKERIKNVMTTMMVFGRQGEAYITRDELKDADIQWFIFNYADKANYVVSPKDKSAMKMPLINFQKMAEKAAKREADRELEDGTPALQATDEYATINGFKARKFVQVLSNGTLIDQWVSPAVKLSLGDNYVMGARLNTYKFPDNPQYKEMANGYVVRMVQYDKKGNIKYTRTLTRLDKGKADESYFDLSQFKVMDVLGGL